MWFDLHTAPGLVKFFVPLTSLAYTIWWRQQRGGLVQMIGSKKSKVELYFIYMRYISSLADDYNAHSTITKPQKWHVHAHLVVLKANSCHPIPPNYIQKQTNESKRRVATWNQAKSRLHAIIFGAKLKRSLIRVQPLALRTWPRFPTRTSCVMRCMILWVIWAFQVRVSLT